MNNYNKIMVIFDKYEYNSVNQYSGQITIELKLHV